jgi:hypothetical protein
VNFVIWTEPIRILKKNTSRRSILILHPTIIPSISKWFFEINVKINDRLRIKLSKVKNIMRLVFYRVTIIDPI